MTLENTKCDIKSCMNTRILTRGMCSLHYQRWLKYRDPLAGGSKFNTSDESFEARTTWDGDCRVWKGAKDPLGYGYIVSEGKSVRVHRYAWVKERGMIPDDLEVDHLCHNRSCVNIDHLRLATAAENKANLSGPRKSSKTGVRNVSPIGDRYRVVVHKGGKQHHFGYFDTIGEAKRVAVDARKQLFGKYAGKG